MMRLKSKLLSLNNAKAEGEKTKVFSPRNCEELRIPLLEISAEQERRAGRINEGTLAHLIHMAAFEVRNRAAFRDKLATIRGSRSATSSAAP